MAKGKDERLQSLTEDKKIVKYLQEHYQKLLTHFDDQIAFIDKRIADHDSEIARLQEKKVVVAQQFAEAPEQLIALGRQLKKLESKEHDLKGGPARKAKSIVRIKDRIKILRAKLAKLEAE